MAVINSFEQVFGNQVIKQGCFFHLTQNTWRHIQNLGLVQTFNTDPDFPLFAAMIDALAFLPVNDVVQGMAYLYQNVHPHPQALELLDYFDKTYVNGVVRNIQAPGQPIVVRRIPPIFPPALWNVHTATMNNDPWTNNVCESWNNAFYHIVGHNHPSTGPATPGGRGAMPPPTFLQSKKIEKEVFTDNYSLNKIYLFSTCAHYVQ